MFKRYKTLQNTIDAVESHLAGRPLIKKCIFNTILPLYHPPRTEIKYVFRYGYRQVEWGNWDSENKEMIIYFPKSSTSFVHVACRFPVFNSSSLIALSPLQTVFGYSTRIETRFKLETDYDIPETMGKLKLIKTLIRIEII